MPPTRSSLRFASFLCVCHALPGSGASYTRFLEAEDFVLHGLQQGLNCAASYRGDRFHAMGGIRSSKQPVATGAKYSLSAYVRSSATVGNRTEATLELTCELSRTSQYALRDPEPQPADLGSLAPGATKTVRFPLNYHTGDTVEDKPLELGISGPGVVFSRPKVLYYVPVERQVGIVCDGDLSEWGLEDPAQPDPGLTIVGFRPSESSDDCQAQVGAWLRRDDDALYVADVAAPDQTSTATTVPVKEGDTPATARTLGGSQAVEAAARWQAGRWYAEVRLPLSSVPRFQPSAGNTLLFDLEVTDWDDRPALGQIVWAGRRTPSGDPRGFGQIVLR